MAYYDPFERASYFYHLPKRIPDPVPVTRYFVRLWWSDGRLQDDLRTFDTIEEAEPHRAQLARRYQNGYLINGIWYDCPLFKAEVMAKTVWTRFHYRGTLSKDIT